MERVESPDELAFAEEEEERAWRARVSGGVGVKAWMEDGERMRTLDRWEEEGLEGGEEEVEAL